MTEVRRSVLVGAGADHAFKVFTEKFVTWWPPAHHIGEADLRDVVVEPRESGRWYEVGVDGTECDWGSVKVWEPPSRLLPTWHLDGDRDYDPDPARASEVEITFTAEGSGTRVELVHRNFERHFAKPDRVREASAARGWGGILLGFQGAFV